MKKVVSMVGILWCVVLLAWCNTWSNDPIAINDTVTITYDASFEDGEPIAIQKESTFIVWELSEVSILEQQVIGMKQGEKKEVLAKPEEAYGKEYDSNKMQRLAVQIFQELGYAIEIGKSYRIGDVKWIIKGIEGEWSQQVVIFDINEPKTYKNIIFKFSVKKVVKAEK